MLNLFEQQKQRSVGTSLQSDHRLYCSLLKKYNVYPSKNDKNALLNKKSILAGFSSCVTCVGFWLQNSEDRFSHVKAYRKVPKWSDSDLLYSKHSKIQTKRFYLGVILLNDANGIANSGDPDQTAPLGAV